MLLKKSKTSLTTYQVSRYCEVYVSTVANWIKTGKLPFYRTPGGHHRIKRTDLIKFMRTYSMPIPEDLLQGKEARILIVDDNPAFGKMMMELFYSINPKFIVVSATTGFEAGKQLMNMLPDLIFLDIYMPGIDGFEVCTNIRNDPRTRETKIVAITGDKDIRVKNQILSCGADDILYKPLLMKELKEKVTSILELE